MVDKTSLRHKENKSRIVINVQNDMSLETIVSVMAHECTHHLLISNNINICPQCGAPVEGNSTGICEYCKSKLINNITIIHKKN